MSKTKVSYNTIYNDMRFFLQKYHSASEEMSDSLFRRCTIQWLKKGDLLVTEKTVCDHLYMLIDGICSCSYSKNGKDYVLRFIKRGEFGLFYHAFLGKQKSLLNIKAMQDTVVLCLNKEDFDHLAKQYIDFVLLFNNVMLKFLAEEEEREYQIRSNDAEGRIIHFQHTHEIQYLQQNVPRYSIATYLNMEPETFAKILGRLNKGI